MFSGVVIEEDDEGSCCCVDFADSESVCGVEVKVSRKGDDEINFDWGFKRGKWCLLEEKGGGGQFDGLFVAWSDDNQENKQK